MFRRRSTLQRRDRDSGLAFNWRVPVSSIGSFLVAFLVVGAAAALLALGVTVRIGKDRVVGEQRALVTLVPSGPIGDSLWRTAVAAGPFPFRHLIAGDGGGDEETPTPLSVADPPYQPELSSVEISSVDSDRVLGRELQVFPPLPEPVAASAVPEKREVSLALAAVGDPLQPELETPSRRVPVAEAEQWLGRRFMVEIGPAGRAIDVVPLAPGEQAAGVEAWLRRARVKEGRGRWMVVECVQGR
ncbi:hypothetical protein [Haloferula sargassicola]|uniref:Uncharacterized protein n=1 Tax=Haloferula sargassicola TaxID=490096 RepID=A0ABP9UQE0_9BACT